jgi:dihydrofolate reductase
LRRLIASEMVTVDGFFARPNGALDWFVESRELKKSENDLVESADTILYGRVTYQMMAVHTSLGSRFIASAKLPLACGQ